jgi:hypothetical protein
LVIAILQVLYILFKIHLWQLFFMKTRYIISIIIKKKTQTKWLGIIAAVTSLKINILNHNRSLKYFVTKIHHFSNKKKNTNKMKMTSLLVATIAAVTSLKNVTGEGRRKDKFSWPPSSKGRYQFSSLEWCHPICLAFTTTSPTFTQQKQMISRIFLSPSNHALQWQFRHLIFHYFQFS